MNRTPAAALVCLLTTAFSLSDQPVLNTLPLIPTAHAADLTIPNHGIAEVDEPTYPVPVPGDWSGLYGGLHTGFGAFTATTTDWAYEAIRDPDGDIGLRGVSAIAGAQIGYNRQIEQIFYGLEGDFAWTGFDKNKVLDKGKGYLSSRIDWLATIRGRLGLVAGNGMAYVTGGLALAQAGHCANRIDAICTNGDYESNNNRNIAWDGHQLGLVAGVGIEARLSKHLSLKGEYLYMHLDDKNIVYGKERSADAIKHHDLDFGTQVHMLRLGLNYHLNPMEMKDIDHTSGWSGAYAGIHAGLGAFTGTSFDWDSGIFIDPDGDINLKGFAGLAGAQVGYNQQMGNILYGFEGDIAWTDFDMGRRFKATNYIAAKMDWLATARARLGVVAGNGMAYVTGGLALAQVGHCAASDFDSFVTQPCIPNSDKNISWDGIQFGLVVGAGIEARLSERLSMKGEYLYVQLEDENVVYQDIGDRDISLYSNTHLVRLGLNYHLTPMAMKPSTETDVWSGLYVGLQGGGGAVSATAMDWYMDVFEDPDGDYELTHFSALAGVQVGYNHQIGNIVYGVAADAAWMDFDEERKTRSSGVLLSSKMDWLATIRGRVGMSVGNGLAYVTAGAAFANVDHCATAAALSDVCGHTDGIHDSFAEWDGVRPGLVAGGGAETRLTDGVSIKGEYLYVNLAEKNRNVAKTIDTTNDMDFGNYAHLFRVGLNYKLN